MIVASDTISLLSVTSLALIVMVGLALFGIMSQGLAFVVLAVFAGFALYVCVLMKEGDDDELN